jgi:hypothetical protein
VIPPTWPSSCCRCCSRATCRGSIPAARAAKDGYGFGGAAIGDEFVVPSTSTVGTHGFLSKNPLMDALIEFDFAQFPIAADDDRLDQPWVALVLAEAVPDWFVLDGTDPWSPFMLRVFEVVTGKREKIPAVVHPDGTCRIQSVSGDDGRIYDVISAFHQRTGVPLILNTSLNVMGEPIVETPDDALWVLLYTGLDHLVLEDRVVSLPDSYRSVLDLVPHPVVGTVDFEHDLTGGTLVSGRPQAISFEASTPWGTVRQTADGHHADILAELDGVRNGKEILAALEASGSPLARSPEVFHQALAELRRLGLIRMRGAS